MCLTLYLASEVELPLRVSDDISVDRPGVEGNAVRPWLSLPEMYVVGAHTGCSCGFPRSAADEAVAWHEDLFDERSEDRIKDVASMQALLIVIDELLAQSQSVELFPVWSGAEEEEPLGMVELRRQEIVPARFVFTEQFLYRVS